MILLAIDKFKGSATSVQIALAAERGLHAVLPDLEVVTMPIADGGDGTLAALAQALPDAQWKQCSVTPPVGGTGPTAVAKYLVTPDGTAVMELAAASGIALAPHLDALHAQTIGTGDMIAHAIGQGCRHIVLGIGGSASTDCGTGLLSRLGFKFLNKDGHTLPPCGASLASIASIDASHVPQAVRDTRFTLMSDVDNPLCGPQGSAAVFAPQKGADSAMVALLEQGTQHFATLLPEGIASKPGAGAAGGVGAGMMGLLGAQIKPGALTVLHLLHFDEVAARATLIVTGEGRIDASSAHGKAPAAVLQAGQALGVPVVALCGQATPEAHNLGFFKVIDITPAGMPLSQAMRTDVTLTNVQRAAFHLASTLKHIKN